MYIFVMDFSTPLHNIDADLVSRSVLVDTLGDNMCFSFTKWISLLVMSNSSGLYRDR